MNETSTIIKTREVYEDTHYTREIDCPLANNDDGHQATVFEHGHRLAGYIECEQCEAYEACEHEDTRSETIEVTAFYGDQDTSYNQDIEVCELCECAVEEA